MTQTNNRKQYFHFFNINRPGAGSMIENVLA